MKTTGFVFTPRLLERIAERFRALGEPSRLQVLNALRERTVNDLVRDIPTARDETR